jgi:hypothetical protein
MFTLVPHRLDFLYLRTKVAVDEVRKKFFVEASIEDECDCIPDLSSPFVISK